jgi:GGDEF domain-containing protein
VGDILFRYGSNEFVAVLNDTTPDTARAIADRIIKRVHENPLLLGAHARVPIQVRAAEIFSPRDGTSLAALINTARSRTSRVADLHSPTLR